MYVVVVEFNLHREHAAAFRERVQQQAVDSLQLESNCHYFDVCSDPERDDFVLLYEVYSDRAAFDAHLASAHFSAFDAEVKSWIKERKLSFFERL